MVGKKRARQWVRVVFAAGLLAVMAAVPAGATPDSGEGHTIEICHVTNSETNQFVLITVDVAAFDGEGANDHTGHMSKDGREDFPLGERESCYEVNED